MNTNIVFVEQSGISCYQIPHTHIQKTKKRVGGGYHNIKISSSRPSPRPLKKKTHKRSREAMPST